MEYKRKGENLPENVSDYVVFDLETTGLSPWSDAIVEISAVKVRQNEVAETFSTLVNPGCVIPPRASAVNGITDEMVADAPCLSEALSQFLSFIGTEVLVGHNIRAFDMKFVNRAVQKMYGRELPNDLIDTLILAKRCLPQLPRHRLVDLSEHFHISTAGAHRAMNDCMMNQRCFEAMKKQMGEMDGTGQKNLELRCPRCQGALKLRNGRFGSFYGCENFPRCRYTRNC